MARLKRLFGLRGLLVLVLAMLMVISVACGAADTPAPDPVDDGNDVDAPAIEQVIRVPEHEPAGFDPTKGGHGYYATVNMFDRLVDIYSETGKQKPMAAESWEWSDDGTELTFYLREDMYWTDGNKVTAGDFRYSWIRHLDPATGARDPSGIFPIVNAAAFNRGDVTDPDEVGIEVVDDYTLRIYLDAPSPQILQILGTHSWMPLPEWVVEEHGERWMLPENIVSQGAFKMESWSHDRELVLVKNEDWWGPDFPLDRIEFVLMEDAWGRGIFSYEAGEVDWAEVPAGELDRVSSHSELSEQLHNIPLIGIVYFMVDTENPPLDDVRIRQAIHMAIDRDVLTRDVLAGAFEPAYNMAAPGLLGRNDEDTLGYDPDRARELLAEAGYPNGEGLRDLELTFWSVDRARTSAEALQAQLKEELNINLRLQPLEPAAMGDWRISRRDQPFDFYWSLSWSGSGDPTTLHDPLFDSEFSHTRNRFSDPDYDRLIRQARQETDPDVRAELYYEAESILNYELPTIPLFFEAKQKLIHPRVKGLLDSTSPLAVTIIYWDGVEVVEP